MQPKIVVAIVLLVAAAACVTTQGVPKTALQTAPNSTDTIGKFVWHELVTDDVAAVRRFYGELLGWEFTETTRRGRPYFVIRQQGQLVGGVVPVAADPTQEVSQWIGFQSVADVDAAVAAVEKAGGKTVVAPVDIATTGRAALVTDPQGAPIGFLRLTAGDPPDSATPPAGRFFWMEYLAKDPAAAARFYGETFGYERRVTDKLGTSEYVVLWRGRPRGGILQAPRPDMRPTWLPYVLVAEPVPLVPRVRALGGTVVLEPRRDVRNESLAVVMDPSGAIVALQKYPF